MFPHKKLDWHTGRLEGQIRQTPDDPEIRHELARCYLSSGLYHGGGEALCNKALGQARKVLNDDPSHVGALVTAGTALVGMGRPDAGRKFLDEAIRLDAERADLHLALGALHRSEGDRHLALRHLESACRLSPDSWEAHLYLGRVLGERARELPEAGRLVERAQFHLVQALKLGPSQDLSAPLLRDLGLSCLQTGRFREAEKFFLRLREHDRFRHVARYHLGMVAYHLGKYNNAIQHFRQYLSDRPDDPRVHARMGMAYLQLSEHKRAREACNQALMLDPGSRLARYALGCSLLEEGNPAEALRVFKEALQENPDHMEAYLELTRTRRLSGDVPWLGQALAAEVRHYDRLPPGTSPGTPRHVTRHRVGVLLDQLRAVGPATTTHILDALPLVQDEGLRFQLWEAACSLSSSAIADDVAVALKQPDETFGIGLARNAVATAGGIPEPVLTRGLGVKEEDLKRAAVERAGPAADVGRHRQNVESLRREARAYQALLLLAIASRRSRSGRRLLETWASTADPELAVAAQTGLAMYGDPKAIAELQARADLRRAGPRIRMLLAGVVPPRAAVPPRAVSDTEDAHCSSCGRTSRDAAHLMAGTDAVICDVCVLDTGRKRRQSLAPDEAVCAFCGKTHLECKGVYRKSGVDICSDCLELSLGLMEREDVDRFLATY
ncbi:MAG: tetratricopeptide repeat protein [Proteobacteria bacterium]|nr:tetratricopeptide repeat protein [Pseudomonadota bacterium]MCP4920314.1 tetratricopeptide repeat protein [Pseudomonadota bacterium]